MTWRQPVLVGLILAHALIAAASEHSGVSVRDAWLRESPPGVSVMAGYMVLRNDTSRVQVLVGARSSAFENVMMHRTIARNGMSGMEHAAQIELSANATLQFLPGGYHLMLANPKRTLRAGDRVDIDLEFLNGRVLRVAFEVRK